MVSRASLSSFFFFNDTATTEIYTLSLHDALPISIKLSSPGPVLFRQKRIGQYGVPFTCLKFRSMHAVNDSQIHKEYVTRFIAGSVDAGVSDTDDKVVYKLTADPRVTRVGRLLRKTSL